MNFQKWFFVFLLLVLSAPRVFSAEYYPLSFYSEDFPPFNYLDENEKLQGPSVDTLLAMFERLGLNTHLDDILVYPWARSYKLLLSQPGTVLFVVTRTAERESLFKWVGPVTSSRNVMIGKKIKTPHKLKLDDILEFNVVVVRNDAAGESLLSLFNQDKISTVNVTEAEQAIRMLDVNRMDLFAYDENVFNWVASKIGLNTDEYASVFELSKSQHYFAFHKDTPDAVIREFQNALDAIKQDGTWERILKKHGMKNMLSNGGGGD